MANDFIYSYIQHRMAAMGYKNYSVEPVLVQSPATAYTIPAYNEFYYLVSKSVDGSLKITSDIHAWMEWSNYTDWQFFQYHEFSGVIEISQAVPINLEFIRVTING